MRFLRSFAIFLTVLLTLTSCTSNEPIENPPEETEAFESSEDTTLKNTKVLELRVCSYNIANGRYVDHDMQKLADDILSVNPDIVGLQEVDRFAKRSKFIDTVTVLSELTGLKYFCYTKAIGIAGTDERTGEYGTAILSRYPITEKKSYALDSGGKEQRMLGYVKIDVEGVGVSFFNTHLSYESTDIRRTQWKFVSEKIKELPEDELVFLTGDFNVDSIAEFSYIKGMSPVCNAQNALVTFPSAKSTIDNIFNRGFTVVRSAVIDNGHSDHNMLYADYRAELTVK